MADTGEVSLLAEFPAEFPFSELSLFMRSVTVGVRRALLFPVLRLDGDDILEGELSPEVLVGDEAGVSKFVWISARRCLTTDL